MERKNKGEVSCLEKELRNITWTCHICGKERPDAKISVHTTPLIIGGQVMGDQNVRYCNDNPECRKKAQDYKFVENT